MKIGINPKNKLFRWGPIDGRPLYAYYWHPGFIEFTKEFPPGWATFISYIENEKFTAIADFGELYDKGEKVFKKFILDDKKFSKNLCHWNLMLVDFFHFRDSIEARLKGSDKKDLAIIIKDWNALYGKGFWNIGSLPEVANWGGEQMLQRELKKKLRTDEDFHYAMERLSAPEDFSFYQMEELDLLALKKIKNKKELERKLMAHQKKYHWLLNSYHHTQVLPVSYFKKILKSFSAASASKKINEIKKLKNEAIAHKHEVVDKFSLSSEVLKIGQRLAFCIWWQDLRKSYIFQANHVIDVILSKVAKEFRVNFDDLHFYSVKEIEDLVCKNKKLNAGEIRLRKKNFFIVFSAKNKKELNVSGPAAKKLAMPFLFEKVDKTTKELKGLVVNRGKARGRVRILLGTADFKKMKKGDILVAAMTAPEYIIALKKAAAVVTDEGGMTCHAAIVSRELKIPGIVATKFATKLLKDGDLVEVDANQGTVRIL